MTKTVFAGMETTQDPMGESVSIRTNSAAGRLRCSLSGCERPHKEATTGNSVLTAPVFAFTIVESLPAVVASKSIWESAPGSCARDEGGPLVAGLQDLAAKRLALRW